MKKITKIEQCQGVSITNKKVRVAAYCRVSTDSEEQHESLETQKDHYSKFIKSNCEWEYAGLYYDEGISGTKKERREGLLTLISDCEKGLIDLVYTKSISRFSRNTTDCLEIVRKLLDYGVFVYFEKENLNTESMESELMLSVLSSLAERESVSISENEKWSARKRFEKGTYTISYPPYGYENKNGEMKVVIEQAPVVKQIFADALSGKGTHAIAVSLNKKDIPSKKGGKWTASSISAILRNEKYTGDVIFQKTYTDSNFKRHINRGEKDKYLCQNHHEQIISHEDFEKVQKVLRQRGLEKGIDCDTDKYLNRYAFSGRIVCGECGSVFKRRIHYKPSGNYIAWCCNQHIEDKNSCSMKYITDEAIKYAFLIMMNKLQFGRECILRPLQAAVSRSNAEKNGKRLKELETLIKDNAEQQKTTAGLLSKGYLDRAVFIKANNELLMEKERLKSEKDFLIKMNESGYQVEQDIKELISFLGKSDHFTEFNEDTFSKFVEKIIVNSRTEIEFELKIGLKLKERL